jgi:hypothetical protein
MTAPNFGPHMPEVDVVPEIEGIVAKAWAMAESTDGKGRSPIAITPSHRLLFPLGVVPAGQMSAEHVRPMEALVPREPRQRIVVIALNTVETLMDEGWKRSIPFAGYLLGMCYIGHAVVITEGHSSVLAEILKGADLLFVDGGMVPFLQRDWTDVARRSGIKRIVIFGRDGTLQQLVADVPGGAG